MKTESNQQQQHERESRDHGRMDRRKFLTASALSAAGLAVNGLFDASLAQVATPKKANAKNVSGQGPYPTEGMAAYSPSGPHKLMKFERRALGPKDVAIRVQYCGVCHSDIHTIRGDWGKIQYPLITGHELAGEWSLLGSG